MKKPTKLGYCTSCNTKIWIFDADGVPFKRRDNYCEILVDLSDGSRGRLAFCKGCVEKGFDAQEAIENAIAGKREELSQKSWSQPFKDWHFAFFEHLKIMSVRRAIRLKERGLTPITDDKFEDLPGIGKITNLHAGKINPRKWTRPPDFSGLKSLGDRHATRS